MKLITDTITDVIYYIRPEPSILRARFGAFGYIINDHFTKPFRNNIAPIGLISGFYPNHFLLSNVVLK